MTSALGRSRHAPLLPALALLGACWGGQAPIRIGVAGPWTGDYDAMGSGARLAAEELNAAGGIDGRPIEIVSMDDHGDVDSAIVVATRLYASDVVAVVGHNNSANTLAAAPIYNGGERPLVELSPSSSSPAVREAGPYTFRVTASDLVQVTAAARWLRNRLELERGAVIYANEPFGRGVRTTFLRAFRERNGTIVDVIPAAPGTPEVADSQALAPFLELLRRRGDVQFLVGAGSQPFARQLLHGVRRAGLRATLLGFDAWDGIEAMGDTANGTYISFAYFAGIPTAENQAFVKRWQERYPGAPLPSQPAQGSYDAVRLLAHVMRRSGPDRARLRDALADVGRRDPAFPGLLGPIAFDAEGDLVEAPVFAAVVRDGRLVYAGRM